MRRIYFFMFLAAWMFAACSSNSGTVKTDAPATDAPMETQAAAPTETNDDTSGDMSIPEETMAMQDGDMGTPEETSTTQSENNVFHHSAAGFKMTKPMDWKFMSPEMVKMASQSTKWNDEELEKAIRENPNSPLVVITRYSEPYPTLNPNVTVTMVKLPVEGMPPKDILNMSTEVLKRAYPDLTYVDEVQDANVDGLDGAYTKIKYTIAAGGKKFPTTARMWLVPRGKVMFTVGMSGPQEGPDVSEDAFKEILNSIKIDKK